MKKSLLMVPLGLLLLTGCTRTWVMTLNNGSTVGTIGKPKLKNGVFAYKDFKGQIHYEPAGRVREIAPASMAAEKQSQFLPK